MIVVNSYDNEKMERFCSEVEKGAENVSEVVDHFEKVDANFSAKRLSLKPLK